MTVTAGVYVHRLHLRVRNHTAETAVTESAVLATDAGDHGAQPVYSGIWTPSSPGLAFGAADRIGVGFAHAGSTALPLQAQIYCERV